MWFKFKNQLYNLLILISCFPAFSQTYIMSNNGNATTCSGIFLDPGGTGQYANNLDYVYTLYPSNSGTSVFLEFTSFNVHASWWGVGNNDYLEIYDGPNTTSPLIGVFDNNNSLNGSMIGATNPSGSLTFKFHSNSNIRRSGWSANISCVNSCNSNNPAGNTCNTATPICDLNGYCGNTSSSYTDASWTQLDNEFCGWIDNNSFISFVAGATSVTLDILVYNCAEDECIQMMIFSGSCYGAITDENCIYTMYPGTNTFTTSGLTIGQTYYLMIDGCSGDVCEYIVNTSSSSGILAPVTLNNNTDTICSGSSTTLSATGGDGTYNWSPSTGLNTTTGSSVTANPSVTTTYTVTSLAGNTLCPTNTTDQVTITVIDPPIVSVNNQTLCSEDTATITAITSTTGTYNYTWTVPSGIADPGNVASFNTTISGVYTVIASTDNTQACNSFPASGTLTINSNINVSPSINNPSCNGFNNGSINLNISGGSIPYQFNWNNGSNTQNISNLNAGVYTLMITDSLGCSQNETYNLIDPPIFNPTINTYNISCFGLNDGIIEVINEPLSTTYLWSNNSTSSSINNLNPGNYSVNVTDSSGCVLTEFFNLIEPSEIIVNSSSNDISCYGANDGSIDLFISGGLTNYTVNIPPYSQALSNGVTNYYSQSILSAGEYIYTVIDSNNCTVSDTIIIIEPDELTTNPIISNVLCKNENNGNIILNTTGGILPYIEDFGGNNPLQLSPGFYTYTITDNNGCLLTDTFSISEPDSLLSEITSTDATCAGYFDGTASLSITGGTVPYVINWFGNNPNNLNAGFYNYSIVDNNGCTSNGNITINEPLGMQIIIDTFRVSCYGGSDGIAILNVSGGAGSPYNINWGGLDPNSLPAGDHIVTVIDSNNCYVTDTAFITQPNEILTNPIITNVSCFGDINGSALLQITGGVPPYNQTWFGIDSSYLAPGTYPYQVTDGNNCIKDTSITIYEPDTLRAIATIIDIDCFGNNNGAINLDITGGTSPYSIDFGNFDQYALVAGTYNYTITDINGCSFDSASTVNEANQIFLDFIATSPICRYDESILSINISNTLSNTYTIILQDSTLKSFVIDSNGLLISEGTPIILTPNFSRNVNIISLTDNEGCTQTFNDSVYIEVKQLPELTLNEDDVCVGELSFTLNKATPIGGTYFINNVMTNYFDIENFDPGNYAIKYEYTDPLTLCYNEIIEIITISESPEAGMLFSPQPTNIEDPNILFRDNSSEDVLSSEWHLGDGTIIYNKLDFWHTYTNIGTFMVEYYITNIYGCSDSVKNQITINPNYSTFIPDAFTPNNDGNNDFFMPFVIGDNGYNIKIFDRWGNIIFNEDNKKWDGKINTKPLPNGIYNYSITIFDFVNKPFIYTGMLNLIR